MNGFNLILQFIFSMLPVILIAALREGKKSKFCAALFLLIVQIVKNRNPQYSDIKQCAVCISGKLLLLVLKTNASRVMLPPKTWPYSVSDLKTATLHSPSPFTFGKKITWEGKSMKFCCRNSKSNHTILSPNTRYPILCFQFGESGGIAVIHTVIGHSAILTWVIQWMLLWVNGLWLLQICCVWQSEKCV